MAVRTFYHYDAFDRQLGTLQNVYSAVRKWTLNDTHTLTIETTTRLDKRDRILYREPVSGAWREFIVTEVDWGREDGAVTCIGTCEDSIAELLNDYIDNRQPDGTAQHLLNVALEAGGSRWVTGTVNVTGTAGIVFYHQSVREAITEIINKLGGELSTTIDVDKDGVIARHVNITTRVGDDRGKRFTYAKDLTGIHRLIGAREVYTRLYGFGSGVAIYDEETGEETGGFSRKIKFGDINGGLDYVEDDSMLPLWGRPDGHGGYAHSVGIYEDDTEDVEVLLERTKAYFEEQKTPDITYEASVIDLKAAGFDTEGVSDGDTVAIIDTTFEPELRLTGRVIEDEENLLINERNLTLGHIQETLSDMLVQQAARNRAISDHWASWDGAANLPEAYLQAQIDRLNDLFNAYGSYMHQGFENGIIFSNVPLDDNGKPTKTPATGMQLTGAGFRIASEVGPNGEFNWRTFGTGEGFTADCIVAGVIKGGSNYWNLETGDLYFIQGRIQDARGNSWNMSTGTVNLANGKITDNDGTNFWDLENAQFSFSSGALTVDGESFEEYVQGVAPDSWLTADQEEVFNRLTNNGASQGLYLTSGNLYINATYIQSGIINAGLIRTGTITDVNQNNYWNLNTGEFSLRPGSTKVGNQTLEAYVEEHAAPAEDSFQTATPAQVFAKLTNNGQIQGITMTGNSLYINASYINSGVLSVANSSGRTLFKADIGSKTVQIADFVVAAESLTGPTISLFHNGLQLKSEIDNGVIGQFASGWGTYAADQKWMGMVLNSNREKIFMAATANIPATGGGQWSVDAKLLYNNRADGDMSAGTIQSYANWSFHGWQIHNAWMNENDSGAVGGVSGRFGPFTAITNLRWENGTVGEALGGCYIDFKNGFATGFYGPN